jgi:hypothetical protein
METVKIVFDIDTSDVKTSTQDLVALNKVTETEVEALKRLEAESNANKVAFQQLNKELKSANTELLNAKKTFGDTSKEAQSAQKNVDALTDKMAELKTTVKPVEESFVSLRTQLKLAKEEAVKAAEKFGEFSAEANAARTKAGALADQMGDLNRQVGLLNPEAKAKAFSNLASGVVGAFSIATGAVQAFGIKNKEVEAAAQKLQAALNITQGIASLGQLKESYEDIKVVLGFTTAAQEALTVANTAEAASATGAAAATRAFTAALLTNPIFLAVAAIAALAGVMIALGDDTEEAKTQVDLMTESQKALRDATNSTADATDKLAVAQGKLSSVAAQINKTYRDNATDVADLNEKLKVNNAAITDNNKVITKYQTELQNYAQISKITSEAVAAGTMSEADAQRTRKSFLGEATRAGLAALESNKKLAESNKEITQTIKEKNKATEATVATIKEEEKTQNTEKKVADAKKLSAEQKQAAKEEQALIKERLRLSDDLRKKLQENVLAETKDPAERIQMARKFADENYAIDLERLQSNGATQDAIDLRAAEHTAFMKNLSDQEIKINQDKTAKLLTAEKKLQDALLALSLAKETDPLKRAQIINDAKEKEIDDKLALVEKGSVEEQALLAEKEKAEIDAAKRIAAAQIEVNKTTNDAITEEEKKAAEDRKALQEGVLQSAQFIGQAIFEASANQTNAELALLEEQKSQKLISEKDYQEKVRKLKQKQAEDQKKEAIFNATVDLARAIIAALTIAPPASAVAANFAAILGGANLAKIIATPVPKFQKGTLAVPGVDMGRDSVHAMLQPGEAVIPVSTNRAYHPTIKAIYEKKISPSEINNFVMSRTSSAGRQSVTASVDTYALSRALGKNKTVEVGNAGMIGRAMAKELLRGQNLRRS